MAGPSADSCIDITDSRLRRADLAMDQERLDELNEELANLRRENDRGQPAPRSAMPVRSLMGEGPSARRPKAFA